MLYELNGLVKRYGSRTILDIDHLAFQARKIYALIGPNGAGKTTLLNHLAFLDQPTSGKLSFFGSTVAFERSELSRLRRRVVLVDQSPILFSGSVWKNIEFGLRVRRMPARERILKIEQALERVGMEGFAHSGVQGLSGGEVKRVAFARALALDPEVLLCDEPTANVDREHQEIIMKIIEHANSVRNTSVIFSTHYLSQSRRLADQTILLQNGRIAENVEVNVFTGRLVRDTSGDTLVRIADRHNIRLGSFDSANSRKGNVRIHVAPDRVALVSCSPDHPADPPKIAGTVQAIGIEKELIRIEVDIGVPLQVLMPVERFQSNPFQVCSLVEVVVSEEGVRLVK